MVGRKEDPRWSDPQRARLDVAVKQSGLGQSGCIKELVDSFGIAPVKQGTLSRWISGSIRTPTCIDELIAFSELYAPEVESAATADEPEPERSIPRAGSAAHLTVVPPPEPEEASTDAPVVDAGWQHARAFAQQLDALRAELRRERARSLALARDVEQVARKTAEALESADRMDDLAETYSRALQDRLG